MIPSPHNLFLFRRSRVRCCRSFSMPQTHTSRRANQDSDQKSADDSESHPTGIRQRKRIGEDTAPQKREGEAPDQNRNQRTLKQKPHVCVNTTSIAKLPP